MVILTGSLLPRTVGIAIKNPAPPLSAGGEFQVLMLLKFRAIISQYDLKGFPEQAVSYSLFQRVKSVLDGCIAFVGNQEGQKEPAVDKREGQQILLA